MIFSIFIASCGTVEIHDDLWCADRSPYGARCVHLNSGNPTDVPKEQWEKDRVGMICGSAQSFADVKAELLKLCNHGRCTYDQLTAINNLSLLLDAPK